MEILPVTSSGLDIILRANSYEIVQFKPRAIALISAGVAWIYSSNMSKIHKVRDQDMEELLLSQHNSCY